MLVVALLAVIWLLLQDTTAAVPASVGIGGFVVGYILKNIVPLVSSVAFKWWNTKAGSWYAGLSNPVKMTVYVAVTVVLMFLVSVAGLGWDRTTDPAALTPEFFQSLVMALISTFLVKIGINTEQIRSGRAAAKKRAAAATRGTNG